MELVPSRQRSGRRRRALERPDLALPAYRLRGPQPSHGALRRRLPALDMTIQDWGVTYDELEPHFDRFEYLCGTSGTAGNLEGKSRRAAILSRVRASGPIPLRRKLSPMRPPCSPLPPASSATIRSRTIRQSLRSLHQPARHHARPVHLLRLLRALRLRQLFEGEPTDDDPADPRPRSQLRSAHAMRGDPHQPRCLRHARDRRHLRRYDRQRMGAARGDGPALRLPALQRPVLLLSGIGKPYDPVTGEGVIGRNFSYQTTSTVEGFYDEQDLQPVHRLGRKRDDHRQLQRRQFRPRPLRVRGRRLYRHDPDQRQADRNHPRTAGNAGLGCRVEEGGGDELSLLDRVLLFGKQLQLPGQLSRPRPDLQGSSSAAR